MNVGIEKCAYFCEWTHLTENAGEIKFLYFICRIISRLSFFNFIM
jgi:hypothetical protein